MQDDPERLLSATSEADPLERELLGALRQLKAPAHAKAAAWGGVAAGIAAASLPATASGAAAAGATSSAGAKAAVAVGGKIALGAAAKVALAATLASAALGGAYVLHQRGAAASLQRAHSASAARAATGHAVSVPAVVTSPSAAETSPVTAPVLVPATRVEETAAAPAPAPTGGSVRASAKNKSSELLAQESALLGSARSELRDGDALAAAATLKRLKLRFPKGALLQEREVLAIEVLAARGEFDAAKRQARAFVQRYPNSPHSTQLRELIATP